MEPLKITGIRVSDSSPWLNAHRLRSFPCHTYPPACRHPSDLQIGLRVRDWVPVRLFNRSSHGLDWHLSHQERKHTFLLYWSATGRSIGSVDITSLKLESRGRTQSRARSPSWRSLLSENLKQARKSIAIWKSELASYKFFRRSKRISPFV